MVSHNRRFKTGQPKKGAPMKKLMLLVFVRASSTPLTIWAQQSAAESMRLQMEAEMLHHLKPAAERPETVVEPAATHACFTGVSCGTTLSGATLGGCFSDSGLTADFYTIQGVNGQTVSPYVSTLGNDSILVTVQDFDTGAVL